ncbi:unnamed protein product [Eretmochelys imbricata]
MERGGPALELKVWAAQEMGLPREKVPPDGAFRRMCSGQCAEIWRYVTRHVHHQRNVKKIRGNLLRPLSLSTFSLLYSGLVSGKAQWVGTRAGAAPAACPGCGPPAWGAAAAGPADRDSPARGHG